MDSDTDAIFLPKEGLVTLEGLARHMEKLALSAQVLAAARRAVNTRPTQAQQEAGNYAKGHIAWKGFEIAIENPKGSVRSGKGKDGRTWSITMKNDYGYFKGVQGRDKDHLDVFLGPALDSELVHVVNQVDPKSGRFDEHKVIIGCTSQADARRAYLANYERGWRGCGSIRQFSLEDFATWVEDGDLTKRATVKIPVLGRDPMESIKYDPHFNADLTHMGSLLGVDATPKKKKGRRKRRKKKGADAAQGLPDRRNYGDLSRLEAGRLLDFVIQLHEAQRAGRHYDVRFGNPEQGLYSWATRKELPEPGQRTALFQQPLHRHDYMNFQGTLKGYGAGQVRTARKGQILLTKVSPTKIEFTTADERHPQRYTLLKPTTFKGRDWLLVNATPDQPVPYHKVHMLTIPRDQVEGKLKAIGQGDSVQAKVDGASSLIRLLKDGVEVLSYRSSKATGRPIIHTERIFHGRPDLSIPQELVGSILKGELYGVQGEEKGRTPSEETTPATGRGVAGAVGRDGRDRDGRLGQGYRAEDTGALRGSHQVVAQGRVIDDARRNRSGSGVGEGTLAEGAGQGQRTESGGLPTGDQDLGRVAGEGGTARRHGTGTTSGTGVLGPQELGGLLNSTLAESIRQQKAQNVKLRVMLHGIQQLGNHYIDPDEVPYQERRELLKSAILPHLPADTFHLAESADTPEQAAKMWQQIQSGQHPLTREGVVIHPNLGTPSKGKLTEEQDVHITGTFPGEGKYRGRGVGGFTYALTPGGPDVGKVGTGLTDALRSDMHVHPEVYAGRIARVRSQGPFESGALRAPSLIALHEDYPSFDKVSTDLWCLKDLGIWKEAKDEEHVPTVAVDLDGTIATELDHFDAERIGPPRKGARKWLKRFRRAGARILIHTVRGDVDLIADYMQRYKLPYDHINYNPDQPAGSSGKLIADVYWDNLAVDASGPLNASGPLVLDRLQKQSEDAFLLHYGRPEDVLHMIQLLKEPGVYEPAFHS